MGLEYSNSEHSHSTLPLTVAADADAGSDGALKDLGTHHSIDEYNMNGTRTHAADSALKRKLADDSNPMLAAATKRMKKEVGVLHILAVCSPSCTLQANSGASKRKRAQISSR